MASNFALIKMQLLCDAALLLATLVIRALNSGSMFSHDTCVADSTLKSNQSRHQAFAPISIHFVRVLSIDCASALLFTCILLIAQATCCTIQ